MRFRFTQLGALAACFALSHTALADDRDIPAQADRFMRAMQEQRFDDAAAMFKPMAKQAPATAAQLKHLATRVGGYATVHNVLSLPAGTSLKFEIPSAEALASTPDKFYQLRYTATAADAQPVFYLLNLEGLPPHRVLSLEVHLPAPDAQSRKRAEQLLGGLI